MIRLPCRNFWIRNYWIKKFVIGKKIYLKNDASFEVDWWKSETVGIREQTPEVLQKASMFGNFRMAPKISKVQSLLSKSFDAQYKENCLTIDSKTIKVWPIHWLHKVLSWSPSVQHRHMGTKEVPTCFSSIDSHNFSRINNYHSGVLISGLWLHLFRVDQFQFGLGWLAWLDKLWESCVTFSDEIWSLLLIVIVTSDLEVDVTVSCRRRKLYQMWRNMKHAQEIDEQSRKNF